MNTKDETYFNIAQAAHLVGVTPATIRNWEKRNFITVKRAKNGYRIFSLYDIEILKKLSSFSKQGVPTETLRSSVYSNVLASPKTTVPIIPKKLLGNKWRNNRLSLGLSIEHVANKIGISPSYIHKIENAQTKNVSFEILQKLASFYGENILSYYDEHSNAISPKVKKGAGNIVSVNVKGVMLESLTRCPDNLLTGMIYTIEPGCGRSEASFHNGEEMIYVLTGTITFHLEEKLYILTEGDSLHFKSHVRHKWINTGKTQARAFWVHTSSTPKI